MMYLYWLEGKFYSLIGRIGYWINSVWLVTYSIDKLVTQTERLRKRL